MLVFQKENKFCDGVLFDPLLMIKGFAKTRYICGENNQPKNQAVFCSVVFAEVAPKLGPTI